MDDHNEYRDIRLQKLKDLTELGKNPFMVERFERSHSLIEAKNAFIEWEKTAVEGAATVTVSTAGRIVSRREMGKAMFFDIQDQSGRLQLYVKKDDIGEEGFHDSKQYWDIGDFIGCDGYMFRTRSGEVSLHVKGAQLISMALLQLPYGKLDSEGVLHGGLTDIEQRYRHRYCDLNINLQARDALVKRCRIISETRKYLDGQGFLEVETPILQSVAGGAAAKPFLTKHNALDIHLKLRISLELPLKRLIVGGLEKVYEIGRVFRNEGISTRHNPEFTLMELYQAYANLEEIMSLVENLFASVAQTTNGTTIIQRGERTIDIGKPWRRLSLLDGIKEYAGVDPSEFDTLESAKKAGERVGLPMEKENNIGGIIEKMLERFVQPNLFEPTFITDYPIETSPLAKKRQDDPRFTRRFEAYIFCQEVANAFSELNDPVDQKERFLDQVKQHAAGDEEAHPMDDDFVRALEYGMPPTGGLGIGMDRMAMVLLGAESIRDVLFFPLQRPE